jgi:hypothetical protein
MKIVTKKKSNSQRRMQLELTQDNQIYSNAIRIFIYSLCMNIDTFIQEVKNEIRARERYLSNIGGRERERQSSTLAMQ